MVMVMMLKRVFEARIERGWRVDLSTGGQGECAAGMEILSRLVLVLFLLTTAPEDDSRLLTAKSTVE